jgi:hypothetical protein
MSLQRGRRLNHLLVRIGKSLKPILRFRLPGWLSTRIISRDFARWFYWAFYFTFLRGANGALDSFASVSFILALERCPWLVNEPTHICTQSCSGLPALLVASTSVPPVTVSSIVLFCAANGLWTSDIDIIYVPFKGISDFGLIGVRGWGRTVFGVPAVLRLVSAVGPLVIPRSIIVVRLSFDLARGELLQIGYAWLESLNALLLPIHRGIHAALCLWTLTLQSWWWLSPIRHQISTRWILWGNVRSRVFW